MTGSDEEAGAEVMGALHGITQLRAPDVDRVGALVSALRGAIEAHDSATTAQPSRTRWCGSRRRRWSWRRRMRTRGRARSTGSAVGGRAGGGAGPGAAGGTVSVRGGGGRPGAGDGSRQRRTGWRGCWPRWPRRGRWCSSMTTACPRRSSGGGSTRGWWRCIGGRSRRWRRARGSTPAIGSSTVGALDHKSDSLTRIDMNPDVGHRGDGG